MRADLYDYDGTICPGDTGSAFWLYCLLRRPYILMFIPIQIIGILCYFCGANGKLAQNTSVYCFLRAVDGQKLAQRFAEKRIRKTFRYFTERDRTRPTVVCSASPAFLLRPICDALGVDDLVATDVDPKTGVLRGKTCKEKEKVRRLCESLPDVLYENVYSDSLKHDAYILKLGQTAYHVVHGEPHKIQI